MKKLSWLLGLGAVSLLAGCGGGQTSFPSTSLIDNPLPTSLKTVYGEKAITAVSLLASSSGFETQSSLNPALGLPRANSATPVTEEALIEQFTQYINLMDSFLTEEGKPFVIKEFISDRQEYAYQLEISIKDLVGNVMVYMMYFNVNESVTDDDTSSETTSSQLTSSEVSSTDSESDSLSSDSFVSESSSIESNTESSTNTETQPSEDPLSRRNDDDHDDDEDDEDEDDEDEEDREDFEDYEQDDDEDLRQRDDENSYQDHHDRHLDDDEEVMLEGIVLYEGNEYRLIGFQEVEEDEIETKFFIALDEQNWIKIKQEVEEDEQKYDLSMKKDGEFSRLSFKTEFEDDGELKIKLRTLIANELVAYTFQKEVKDGQTIIKIRIIENRRVTHIIAIPSIDEITGETIYTFYSRESGKSYEGRPGHGRDSRD